jgi:LPXTG-motif cell wall-anchored protein
LPATGANGSTSLMGFVLLLVGAGLVGVRRRRAA